MAGYQASGLNLYSANCTVSVRGNFPKTNVIFYLLWIKLLTLVWLLTASRIRLQTLTRTVAGCPSAFLRLDDGSPSIWAWGRPCPNRRIPWVCITATHRPLSIRNVYPPIFSECPHMGRCFLCPSRCVFIEPLNIVLAHKKKDLLHFRVLCWCRFEVSSGLSGELSWNSPGSRFYNRCISSFDFPHWFLQSKSSFSTMEVTMPL